MLAQHLRGRLDDVAGRRVQRGDLIEHQLLVAERERGDHRRAQRRDGRRGRPLDTLNQLQVVLADQVERQVALDHDGELRQEVLPLLADVEKGVFLEREGLVGLTRLHLGNLLREQLIERSGHHRVLLEAGLHRPQVRLFLLERGVVTHQLVLAAVQTVDDRLDVVLRRLIAAEVLVHLVAEWHLAEQAAPLLQVT